MPPRRQLQPRPAQRPLAPAPPRIAPPPAPIEERRPTCFYDLPAELRIEIYKLTILRTEIWVTAIPKPPAESDAQDKSKSTPELERSDRRLPDPVSTRTANPWSDLHLPGPHRHDHDRTDSSLHRNQPRPHPLLLTTHKVRDEVLPLLHSICPIHAHITNFDFSPLLHFIARIPPIEQRHLLKNPSLRVILHTPATQAIGGLENLRTWCRVRADPYKVQPDWRYSGEKPNSKVCNDLRRRYKRMKACGNKEELGKILKGIQITLPVELETNGDKGGEE